MSSFENEAKQENLKRKIYGKDDDYIIRYLPCYP